MTTIGLDRMDFRVLSYSQRMTISYDGRAVQKSIAKVAGFEVHTSFQICRSITVYVP